MSFAIIDSAATTGITGGLINQGRMCPSTESQGIFFFFFGRIFLIFADLTSKPRAQKRSVLVNRDSNVTPNRSPAVNASDRCPYPLAATLATLCLPGGRSPTFSKWAGTRRGKTADQTVKRSTPRLLTSIVIHQSKAIILLLMKFQFAFSAFHIDIFHIATEL